jgi:hypothetical protein
MSPVWLLSAVLVITALASQPAAAQDRGNSDWSFRLAPYLWFSNLGGSEDLGRPPADQVFGNLIVPVEDTLLKKAWAVRAEIGKGRSRLWLHVSRATIVNETEAHPEDDPDDIIPGAYNMAWGTGEVFGAVQVGPFSTAHAIELYGGARYTRHDQTVTLDGAAPRNINESWIDPVLGVRLYSELGRRFWAAFNTDLGGFSLGSEFAWTLAGELGFRVAGPLDLTMRYNYQEVEYDNGKTGGDAYRWSNGVQQGWLFGAVLKL